MAYKFLSETDFPFKIRAEIKALLGGDNPSITMEAAENTAIAQVKHYIGGRYDLETVFAKAGAERDGYMIQIVLTIMVYQLYVGKTGMKDIPTHRKEEYGDVIEWLKMVGTGDLPADLPTLITDEQPGEVRINSMEQKEWEY